MKKILFLMLSLAVTTGAFAGVKVNSVQKGILPQATKSMKVTKAPAVAYKQNVQSMNINAPQVQAPQFNNVVPGLSVLERSMRPVSFNAAITTQPEGEVSYYRRSGKAIYNQGVYDTSGQLTSIDPAWGDQSGIVTVVENGNKVYFKNLIYDPEGWYPEAWVEGTKSGNTISIALPADYDDATYAQYNVVVRLYWGSTRWQSNQLRWTRSSNTTAYFDIDADGVMTLRNGTSSTQWTGNGLCAAYYYSSSYYFDNAAILNTTLTPVGEIPEAPTLYTDDDIDAMAGDLVEYYRTGYCWKRMYDENNNYLGVGIDEQSGYGYVFYDADGTTVYMRDPVSGAAIFSDVVGHWIKGTKDGNTLTFPVNQYVMWDDETFYGAKINYGLLVEDTTTNYLTYTPMDDVTEFTFTIDGDHIILNDVGYIDEDMTQFVGIAAQLDSAYLNPSWLGALDFYTMLYNVPAAPTSLNVEPVTATTATVKWQDEENALWNVRYREYVDPSLIYKNEFETDADLDGLWGWDSDGDGKWWSPWQLTDKTYCLTSASYDSSGALTPDNWLVTPEVNLDGVISFDAWGQDPKYAAEIFKVYIFVGDTANITDPTTDFIPVSDDVVVTGDITKYTYSVPEEYQGQRGYVAIRHYNVTDMFRLNIDNLFVGDPDMIKEWIYVNGVTDLQTVLEGLTPETTYEVQVQGVNDGGTGYWTDAVQFTTLADQPQPVVNRGDVDGSGGDPNMDDLSLLINYLLNEAAYIDQINYDNTAICDALDSDSVGMDDLSALINYLLSGTWPD